LTALKSTEKNLDREPQPPTNRGFKNTTPTPGRNRKGGEKYLNYWNTSKKRAKAEKKNKTTEGVT